jgi:hypothetical protein
MRHFMGTGLALVALMAAPALAQRGTGDATGVARSGIQPPVVTISGTLDRIETGPCAATTGRAVAGTHVVVTTADGETRNIHLGPAADVADTVAVLPIGKAVTVEAFRTDKLKDGQYIAKSLTFDGKSVTLRDANLRPVWAGRGAPAATSEEPGGSGAPAAVKPGPGGPGCCGACCGAGQGAGPGFGAGRGPGRGAGLGPPTGRGPGRGMGMGPGLGAGRGFRGGRGPA